MVVVDTHALLWYLTGDKKLSKSAKKLLEEAEKGRVQLIVPVVVLLETLVITEKKKTKLDWNKFIEKTFQFPNFVIYPIDTEVVFELRNVDRRLELHDRIVTAIARINNAPLITKDPEIRKYAKVKIVWE